MPDFPFSCPIQVRFSDQDSYGHVNHAVYFSYMEQVRVQFINSLIDCADPPKPRFLIASARCDFRSPAFFGETLTVAMRVSRIGNTSFEVECQISGPDGRVVAEGHSVQVCIGPDERSAPMPEKVRNRLHESMSGSPTPPVR